MTKGSHPFPSLLLLGLVLLLTGCAVSQPTSLYVLTEEASSGKEVDTKAAGSECLRVRLGPITFPGYLDRSGMVTRVAPNRLGLSELHHWAEPLEENFIRVLAGNLDSRLCDNAFAVVSGPEMARSDYRIRVDVHRFEPMERDKAVLRVRWTILDSDSGEAVAVRRAAYEPAIEGVEHQAAAAAMSRAVSFLSRDIAERLAELPGRSESK